MRLESVLAIPCIPRVDLKTRVSPVETADPLSVQHDNDVF